MEKKFILPVSLMFGSVVLFVLALVFLVSAESTLTIKLLFAIIIGGMLIGSNFTCRQAGGPKAANMFRAGVLIVMAGFSYWLVGLYSAIIFLIAFVVNFLIAKSTKTPEVTEAKE